MRDLKKRLKKAIAHFWRTRKSQAVKRGDGWLISGSRARRTAAMMAAAMTSVDFIRICSCIFSAQASRSRAIARFISPISAPRIAQV